MIEKGLLLLHRENCHFDFSTNFPTQISLVNFKKPYEILHVSSLHQKEISHSCVSALISQFFTQLHDILFCGVHSANSVKMKTWVETCVQLV